MMSSICIRFGSTGRLTRDTPASARAYEPVAMTAPKIVPARTDFYHWNLGGRNWKRRRPMLGLYYTTLLRCVVATGARGLRDVGSDGEWGAATG
jgi:hypothetical protein